MPARMDADGWVVGERPGDGKMRRIGDLYEQRFERAIARPVEKVWAALTVPERIAEWLGAPADLDLRVGGRYFVRWIGAPNDDGIYGVITDYDPPRLLAYDWADTGGDTHLRWELQAEGESGTRLVFTQSGLTPLWFIGGFAGWHAFLDGLGAVLLGETPPDQRDHEATYEALDARYRAWFSPFVDGFETPPILRHHEPDGLVIDKGDGVYSLRFPRRYLLPIDKVWAALTEPERLADWFAQARIEPRLGGAVEFRWEVQGSVETGVIVEFEPPRVIAWATPGPNGRRSVVRFELTQEDGIRGTRLVLTQTLLPPEHLLSVASGWHVHLDELPDAAARARPLAWSFDRERARAEHEMAAIVPRYASVLAAYPA